MINYLFRIGGRTVSYTHLDVYKRQVHIMALGWESKVPALLEAAGPVSYTHLDVYKRQVDQGCTVVDVIVEHPIYGQLTGPLHLSSRYDVARFIARSAEEDALPLSNLTEGIHLHTLLCPDEAAFLRVRAALGELGILLEG